MKEGIDVDLPDATLIFPYLNLFTLTILTPAGLVGRGLITPHLPNISILRNGRFIPAPANRLPTAAGAVQIFDVLDIVHNTPAMQLGHIPLSPEDAGFNQQRYWRLPINNGAVLAVLMERVQYIDYHSAELRLVQDIRDILSLSSRTLTVLQPQSDGGGGGHHGMGGGGGGGGPSGRGGSGGPAGLSDADPSSRANKRTTRSGGSAAKKARTAQGDTVDAVEPEFSGDGELALNRT